MSMDKEAYDRMMGKLGVGSNTPKADIPPHPRPEDQPPKPSIASPVQGLNGNGVAPIVDDGSQDFGGYTRKFIKEDWQDTDIKHLIRYHDLYGAKLYPDSFKAPAPEFKELANNVGTANWSEMGTFKTSTGLWLMEEMVNRVNKPGNSHKSAVLIITSKGGKGTFLEAIPEILPSFTLINIETSGMFMYKNGHMLKLPSSHKFVPKEFDFPVVCLAHYEIFSRSTYGQFVEDPLDGMPMKDEHGKLMFKPWSQSDHITQRQWDYVWCDEFHRLKDRKARWTIQIKKIKASVSKHGSSGTGFINKPDEVWQLLNFLHPEKYGSYWHFREKFCEFEVEGDSRSKAIGVAPVHKEEFREIIRSIGVRRELDEVMPHIKKPIFMPMNIELNSTQRRMYNQIRMELKALDEKGVELYAANVLSLLQRLRQITVATPEVIEDYYDPIEDRRIQKIKLVEPSSKIDSVMEILEGLQWDDEKKEPLVVFSCFKDPLELLKARLDKHNEACVEMGISHPDNLYKYIHLDVGDSDLERYRKWHDEFPKLEHRIFMSTLQLGGESINLTPARHVVFLDRSWSPKDNSQGIGRIRRPGQEGQPVVIHINANNTTDQYVESVNNIKHGWFTQIFGKEVNE